MSIIIWKILSAIRELILFSIFASCCDAKKCFSCKDIPIPRICDTVTECGQHESCYTEAVVTTGGLIQYNSGCVTTQNWTVETEKYGHFQHCPNFHNSAYNIVGKRDISNSTFGIASDRSVSKRGDISACVECCGSDFCNSKGCGTHLLPAIQAGPFCFNCDKTLDPLHCTKVKQCSHGQYCSIQENPSFKGQADLVYLTKCMDKHTCDQLQGTQTNGRCPPLCCSGDFCNTHCGNQQPVTTVPQPTTTRPYSQLIEMTCRSLLFKGYFYDSFTNLCVKVSKTYMTQDQAARTCAADGASLMIVDESTKQDFLIYWIFSHRENDTDFWIGANADTIKGHKFHWVDGSELSYKTYNNWGNNLMGQPDDRRVKNENCVYLDYIDNYYWHDDKCTGRKSGFICQLGPFASGQDEMECRKHVFDGYFYDHKTNMCISLNSGQHITQSDAAAACARQSAHLVNIDSRERTSFVLTWIFSNRLNQTDFWIGATDRYDNSTFYWSDGTQLQYTHWGGPVFPPELHGQPDEPRVKNQDCVYMDYIHNYYWYDDDCNNKRKGFICEIPDNGHLDTLCRSHFSSGYYHDYHSKMCMKLHKTSGGVTQAQALHSCQTESARLATIDNADKTNFILSWIFSHGMNDTDFWIGAKDIHNTSTFYWPNGHRLSYTHWYTIVPPPPQTCAILEHVGNYQWQTARCDKPKTGYICEVNKHTVDTQFCNTTGGYHNIPGDVSSGLCIKVHMEHQTMKQAIETCKAENARVVSLETQEKNDNLASYLRHTYRGQHNTFWIGLLQLNTTTHQDFIWVSGKPLSYSNWYTQPTYANHCFYMQQAHRFRWAAIPCGHRLSFICRR